MLNFFFRQIPKCFYKSRSRKQILPWFCLWGVGDINAYWWIPVRAAFFFLFFFFLLPTSFIFLFHLFIFKLNKPPNIRWTELSLIFNMALPVQHLSHGTPLYLRLPLTQSGLGICHLPPCIVHWNDRIPAGTCRSHPACFSWICAQHPNGNMSLSLPLSTSCTWPPSGKKKNAGSVLRGSSDRRR